MMRHPSQIGHDSQIQKRSLAGQVPWNTARETHLARYRLAAFVGWVMALILCMILARPWELALLIMAGCTGVLVAAVLWTGAEMDKMAANKPATGNAAEMTVWKKHDSSFHWFECECGKLHNWLQEGERFPKFSAGTTAPLPTGAQRVRIEGGYPAGQERWALVCACGRGHYKLTATARKA
jgi:hypothetical protein